MKFFRCQAFPEEFPKGALEYPFSSRLALRFRRNIPDGNPPEDIYYLYYIL